MYGGYVRKMFNLFIALSIGILLFIPYYMSLFLMKKKVVIFHISSLTVYNAIMSSIFYIKTKEVFSVPLCVFIFCLLYFFFTYIQYGKEILQDLDFEKIKYILSLKYARGIALSIVISVMIITVVDCIYVVYSVNDLLYRVYFIGLLAIVWVQIICYCIMYKKRM